MKKTTTKVAEKATTKVAEKATNQVAEKATNQVAEKATNQVAEKATTKETEITPEKVTFLPVIYKGRNFAPNGKNEISLVYSTTNKTTGKITYNTLILTCGVEITSNVVLAEQIVRWFAASYQECKTTFLKDETGEKVTIVTEKGNKKEIKLSDTNPFVAFLKATSVQAIGYEIVCDNCTTLRETILAKKNKFAESFTNEISKKEYKHRVRIFANELLANVRKLTKIVDAYNENQ